MTEQEIFLLYAGIFCGVWALTATAVCIWYQAGRLHSKALLIELRKLNQKLDDLTTVEHANLILSRILSGRRA
ncbi:hypothetical protein [Rhizobium ruizarguesonis]|uniref:hypothetical protein n=1 Tax=Rhizobium ruizarguesonis TaxID=2081791 RepID=UPI00102FFA26|nr:hypothetical protein [Rhizobium ruizarguesonis]TBB72034.1 hypothetical protein ELH45_16400 [Rhizobium ruizarguesonis]